MHTLGGLPLKTTSHSPPTPSLIWTPALNYELWRLELKEAYSFSSVCEFLCVVLTASHDLDVHLEMDSPGDRAHCPS